MKILLISNLFPPFVMGGAEMAAASLATWLVRSGHEVCVLTSAPHRAQVTSSVTNEGVRIERRYFPNNYSVYETRPRPPWSKFVWHLRDHYNPHAETICREVINDFRPDIVNTHDLQGLGYNLLREIGRQHLPCVQVLHDFGFLCINMRMFRHGQTCQSHHWPCLISAHLKRGYLSTLERLSFWSPSRALLERYLPHLPTHREAQCIPLPLLFSPPSPDNSAREEKTFLRFLYVGQVIPTKGVAFILSVFRLLSEKFRFEIAIVGSGSSLEQLRAEYRTASWVTFSGRVNPEAVADFMSAADMLLVPSLWFENSPLVVYQALQLELPILASNIGGLPELVQAGVNGELLPPGDSATWIECLSMILDKPDKLLALRKGAKRISTTFTPDTLGQAVLQLFERTIHGSSIPTPLCA